jgi:hypothetical protein
LKARARFAPASDDGGAIIVCGALVTAVLVEAVVVSIAFFVTVQGDLREVKQWII